MNPTETIQGPFGSIIVRHPNMVEGQTWADPLGTLQITLDSADVDHASLTIASTLTVATVPPIIGRTTAGANTAIAAAGLLRGVTTTVLDCEDPGKVVTQNPAPFTQVAPGSHVDYVSTVAPRNLCPRTHNDTATPRCVAHVR